ncbi:MAG: hypothetical protein ABIP55_03020, partial [Tepidisphaeraceae bacterium]
MFSRIPRFSRFNARAWKYQQLFETPRARRLTAAVALTFVALIGTLIFWSPRPAKDAGKRSVVWKAFAPRKAVAKASNADAGRKSPAGETSSLLTPVVIRPVKPAVEKPASTPASIAKATKTGKPA